jgi:hypothetical protein
MLIAVVGTRVGAPIGLLLGLVEGWLVGMLEAPVGCLIGSMIGAVVGFLLGRSLGAVLGRLLGRSLGLLEPRAEPSAKLARVGGFGLPAALGAPLAFDTQAHATTVSATCHASHRIRNRNAARRTRARSTAYGLC